MAGPKLIGWLERHVKAIQSIAAILTTLIALAALIGVKVQIDASARTQQEQSARDIYREFLSLSVSRPEFAAPDYCRIRGSVQEAAYESYLEYLLYTSEQVLSVSPDWESALAEHLEAHGQILCSPRSWRAYPDPVRALIVRTKDRICPEIQVDCQ